MSDQPQFSSKEMLPCTCGHSPEEHGDDPKYPGSTACSAADCDCIAYEADDREESAEQYP